MRRTSGLAALVVVGGAMHIAATGRAAQTGPATLQFEVVSVKPTQPGTSGGPGPFVQTEPGHLLARGTMRATLADRFKLQVHREVRESPVLFLTVAKGGPISVIERADRPTAD